MVTEQIRLAEKSNGQIKEAMPKTEVVAKAKRRRFTAAEKTALAAGSGRLPGVG